MNSKYSEELPTVELPIASQVRLAYTPSWLKRDRQIRRKEDMPMKRFLRELLTGTLAGLLSAAILRFLNFLGVLK